MGRKEHNGIRTIIVEDEESSRIVLRGFLELYCPEIVVVAEASNCDTAYTAIHQHKPQLVLLDIRLEDSTGFDLLFRFENIDFQVIILTAYPEFDYAQQGIRFGVKDYLLKPYNIEELKKSVAKLSDSSPSQNKNNPRILLLPSAANGQTVVRTDKIVLLKAEGAYTTVFLEGGEKHTVSKNLRHFEEQLSFPPFFRVHDSAMVNFNHIVSWHKEGQTGKIILSNGKTTPVSARRLSAFTDHFKIYAETP